MEPLNSVASVTQSGKFAEVWAGTQFPSGLISKIAGELGISESNVNLHRTYLGGGFGRRSLSDYVLESVRLSKKVGKPVKLVWTREDDLQCGAFRPMSYHRMSAGVDAKGNLTAWNHRIVGDGGGLAVTGAKIPFYSVPNKLIEHHSVITGLRLQFWRAVAHGFNKFAIEAFIDEIADNLESDPYEFRRRLMQNSPRELKLLDTVAQMAEWGKSRPEGRAVGISFAERSNSPSAGAAEISVDRMSGKIRVHKFWAAVDPGIAIQPANVVAQMESGIVFGLSSNLTERVTMENGEIQQSNFNDYKVMRMGDSPEIEVTIIESGGSPTGVGESGVPITGGAVANAFAALTGKRLRHMPFTSKRVLEVLSE